MKILQDLRSLIWAEKRSLSAALSSAPVVSSVTSRPAFSALIRTALISKPTVRYFLPNSTARGKPTYPRPMTAILCLLNPRIATPCQNAGHERCRANIGAASQMSAAVLRLCRLALTSGRSAMNRQQCDSQVVDNRRHGLPDRERPDPLGIERYYDCVSRPNLRRLRAPKPTGALPGNDVPIRSHHIDTLPICLLSGPAAPRYVIVTGEA